MAVTFVIGRAGSGKTRRCFDAIVQAMRADPLGPPIYWILPKQATFSAERELTCGSGLPGFSRARVVSFEQLGRDVFEDCGGSSIPLVTSVGRQMVLGHLLRRLQPRLRFFASVARRPGLAAELDSTLDELQRSGRDPAAFAALLDQLRADPAPDAERAALLEKLHDLQLLYEAYTEFLGQERLDQQRRIEQVVASLAGCSFLPGARVFVDGFAEFTAHERRILLGVAKAGATLEIMLLIDPASPTVRDPHALPDDMSLFYVTEMTYRRLRLTFDGKVAVKTVLLREPRRFETAPLRLIERSFFGGEAMPVNDTKDITLTEAPDRPAEVDAAARAILALVAEGRRWREIAVLSRSLGPYHGLIDAAFEEHGIPWFVDRRRTAAHHPLLQFLRALLIVSRFEWPRDAAMALVKSGLAGVSPREADPLENFILEHRLRICGWEGAKPWAVGREAGPESASKGRSIDEIRQRLVSLVAPLAQMLRGSGELSVREIAAEVFATFDRFEVRNTLANWMEAAGAAGRLEERAEHERVWAELVGLFEQMVDLLGEQRVAPEEFADILESGLDQFDLALTPPTVDQVLVGQIDRTRTPQVGAVFVLGLNEGGFPASAREMSVFSDRERRTLRERSLELDPEAHRRALDERFLGYIAFTRATHRLWVSRPKADEGRRATAPSRFWFRLRELFPDIQPTQAPPCGRTDCADVATPRQLVTALMRWVREGAPANSTGNEDPWPALYHWLSTRPDKGDAIDTMRYRAWRALRYSNVASLSAERRLRLFESPLTASVSQIETFAACPFQHFLRYGLRLRSRGQADLGAQDLGAVYHAMLEKLLADAIRTRLDWTADPSPLTDELIGKTADEIARTQRGEMFLASARGRYLIDRMRRMLGGVLAAQRALMSRGQFRPAYASLTFGRGGRLPALTTLTPGGNEVRLHGRIDRVDRLEGGDAVAVIDYKLAGAELSLAKTYYGLSLQLMADLLVLQASGGDLGPRNVVPAAAFQYPLLQQIKNVAHPDEAIDPQDPRFHLREKPRGIFEESFFEAFDKSAREGASNVVHAFRKKDGTFGKLGTSDNASRRELDMMLAHVRRQIGKLSDGILSGCIDITPYRLNRQSPCVKCEFRDVCRFDPTINQYHVLQSMDRGAVLTVLSTGDANAG